ncbi:MAG: hypothetical protein F6K65_39865 [Moorea sp. SIO3C2]|nr:hypothetical protein [Moorena sp. SIO3C2]
MLDTSNKTNSVRVRAASPTAKALPLANRPLVAEQVTQQLIRRLMTIIPVSLDKITILVSKGKMAFFNGDPTIVNLGLISRLVLRGNQSSNKKSDAHVRVAWPFGQGAATRTQKSRITGYIMSVKILIIKGMVVSLGSLGRGR